MQLVFATANKNKVNEIQSLIPDTIQLLSLQDIKCLEDIPETQATIEGNASQKAFYVFEKYHMNCFADDTGLEIEALNGMPGVMSARYAGEQKNGEDNINKVLTELHGETNRKARFKTVVSLVLDGKEIQFEGIVNGIILKERRGSKGFGYDSVFQPYSEIGESKDSFAEMELSKKNKISHRAIAINKLVEYLKLQA